MLVVLWMGSLLLLMRWNRTLQCLSPVIWDITNFTDPSDLHIGFPQNMKSKSLSLYPPRQLKIHFERFGSEKPNRCFDLCGKRNSLWQTTSVTGLTERRTNIPLPHPPLCSYHSHIQPTCTSRHRHTHRASPATALLELLQNYYNKNFRNVHIYMSLTCCYRLCRKNRQGRRAGRWCRIQWKCYNVWSSGLGHEEN